MSDDDFFETDESIEDLRAAWREGEPGTTEGTGTLDSDAMARVGRRAQEWDRVRTIQVDTSGWFAPENSQGQKAEGSATTTTETLELVPG